MNPNLNKLQPYPFERIRILKEGIIPPEDKKLISLSIGEPKHTCPDFITKAVSDNLVGFQQYPLTKGSDALRSSIAQWLVKRFQLRADNIDPIHNILPVNGTREALFSFAQCVVNPIENAKVLTPNPFYQIYEGAAFLAGAEPYYLPCEEGNSFLPDYSSVPESVWQDCQLLYVCSPANPTGAVTPIEDLKYLLILAEKYDFIIASDECYSELYLDESAPPPSLLEAAQAMGNDSFKRCVVFHSLSKRSNAPGLRSGFVAGDAEVLAQFLLYRTYHGCAMSSPIQQASIAAWSDEQHVFDNREQYRLKFASVIEILSDVMEVTQPEASFYLWAKTPMSDELFTQQIYQQQHIDVVPGQYLSRSIDGKNPGENRIRMALVAPLKDCTEAALRIRAFLTH
ncbi:MAG: succinyldiaminopimelate transaminase [Thiotrichaceae bacterium]|nr:succinyldiaminopimelate transaminase [Thiotrichaceae bacterium]